MLRFSPPDWVGRLASGMNWMVGGIVVGVLVGCMASAMVGGTASSIISAGAAAIVLVGFWKVTTADPSRLADEAPLNPRTLTRWSSVAAFVLEILAWAIPPDLPWPPGVLLLMGILMGISISLTRIFATGAYAVTLANRVPDQRLQRHTRICTWGNGLSVGTVALIGVVALFAAGPATGKPAGSGQSELMFPMPVAIAGTVATLIFSIYTVVLIFKYQRRLFECATFASATWANAASRNSTGSYPR